jgi:hypothetical protein
MTIAISGTTGITLAGQFDSASSFGFKNRIINGAMTVWQRATTVTGSTGYSSVDRWDINGAAGSTLNVAQSTEVPSGFSYSTQITVGTASSAAGAYSYALHAIEGYNIADFGFGKATATTVILSFWVKSSVTGTFGLIFRNTGTARYYTTTYTINTANTWEQKTITIAGDTAGTWLITNGIGLQLIWDLGVGSTYSSASSNAWSTVASNYFGVPSTTKLASTAGATFYITGVQLEKGSTATSFDYRPYGTELSLAQRYYAKFSSLSGVYVGFGSGVSTATTSAAIVVKYPVRMRSAPTISQSNSGLYDGGSIPAVTSIGTSYYGDESVFANLNVASGLTLGRGCIWCGANNASAYIDFSSEL